MLEEIENPSIFTLPQYEDNVFTSHWQNGNPKRRVDLRGPGSVIHQWYENGKLEFIQRYREGNPVGLNQWWDKDGGLIREEDYGYGETVHPASRP